MNFDGVLHRSGQARANDLVCSANKRAVADGLSWALTEAYVYAREHAQAIATRTFVLASNINDATLQTIALVPHCYVPPHATDLIVSVRYEVLGDNARGYHKVLVEGSIGDLTTGTVPGQAPGAVGAVATPRVLGALLRVPLVDAQLADLGIDREDMVIVVEANGLDDTDGTAEVYDPYTVAISWVSRY